MKYTKYLILTTIAGALNSIDVKAQNNAAMSEVQAKSILISAMEDAQTKAERFNKTKLLSFTREKVDRDGEIESYRYVPTNSSEGSWNKVDTAYSTNRHDYKVWENDVVFTPESFDLKGVKFIAENKGSLVFDMPIQMTLTVDSDSVEENEQHSNTFRAEVSVTLQNGQIGSFKVYSVEEFSPQLGVTVTSYKSNNRLTEVAAGGPLVISEQSESVRGDFGFFISLDEDTKITNFDFTIQQEPLRTAIK